MESLNSYTKLFNSLYTNTVTEHDFCYVGFDLDKVEVNYDNCISLYDLLVTFNKLHHSFIKEYETLDNLDLAEKIYFMYYRQYDDNSRTISFYLKGIKDYNKCGKPNIYMQEENGEYEAFYLSDYDHIDLDIDTEIIKKYLDLFDKYRDLYDVYNRLKYIRIFCNDIVSLYTNINNNNDMELGDILNEMKDFKICLLDHYHHAEDIFSFDFNMGDEIKINSDKTKVIINNKRIAVTEEEIMGFLKSIYINTEYLVECEKRSLESTQKVKKYFDSSR